MKPHPTVGERGTTRRGSGLGWRSATAGSGRGKREREHRRRDIGQGREGRRRRDVQAPHRRVAALGRLERLAPGALVGVERVMRQVRSRLTMKPSTRPAVRAAIATRGARSQARPKPARPRATIRRPAAAARSEPARLANAAPCPRSSRARESAGRGGAGEATTISMGVSADGTARPASRGPCAQTGGAARASSESARRESPRRGTAPR